MKKVKWLPKAREDLNQICDYISQDSIYYAIKTVNEIVQTIEKVPTFPYLGRRVKEYNKDNIREVIYKSYRIIYEINSNTIYIHRVWHSARKFSKNSY